MRDFTKISHYLHKDYTRRPFLRNLKFPIFYFVACSNFFIKISSSLAQERFSAKLILSCAFICNKYIKQFTSP